MSSSRRIDLVPRSRSTLRTPSGSGCGTACGCGEVRVRASHAPTSRARTPGLPCRRSTSLPYPAAKAPVIPRRSTRLAPSASGNGSAMPGGLSDFGVNLMRLPPGSWSSQRHWHSHEDEFVYVLEGEVTLVEDEGETVLRAGDCAAFAKNSGNGHHMINRSERRCRLSRSRLSLARRSHRFAPTST